ncbi:hypothetical protein [Novosphingobium sp. CECT 9465]|uniref:hypothetical protein n=1 Tax=Novosphingobium sp. CECT 9465 TaxID=2829794 RepID=UPI001E4072E2|nr:hypothetical protein [Novosphingobium sp. CECT 9465]
MDLRYHTLNHRFTYAKGIIAKPFQGVIYAPVAVTRTAFQEDKVMIEAQQRIIDMAPDRPMLPSAADKGVTLFNRLMAR